MSVDAIAKRARKYFEKFFELSAINEQIKKQCIRIFMGIAQNNLPDCFDIVEKSAVNYARESKSLPFQTLIRGFGYEDPIMAITLLKFINQMIFKGEE